MNLFTLLNSNNYFSVNREVAHKIGLNTAILLSEIIDKHVYFEKKGLLDDGWFYLTVEVVEERTTLAKDAQFGAVKKLVELGLIECKQRGMPAKRNFRVNVQEIEKMFAERGNSSNKKEETRQQDLGKTSNKISEKPPTAPLDASIYKETKEETKLVCNGPPVVDHNVPSCLEKFSMDGALIAVNLQDIFYQSISQRKSWDTQEIHDSWKILADYKGPIRDPFAFIEGTIDNLRTKKQAKFLNTKKKESKECQKKEMKEFPRSSQTSLADASQGRPSLQSLLDKMPKQS